MTLEELHRQIRKCKRCELYKTRKNAVPGEGNERARIFFYGEAPGLQEDLKGKPFVGEAGKFLDRLLSLAGLQRKEVFITSVLKCRPPENRNPSPSEIAACFPWSLKQIEIIKPKIIVCLGRFAKERFLSKIGSISQVHGRVYKKENKIYIPMYHPAASIHNPSLKDINKKDFQKLKKILKGEL